MSLFCRAVNLVGRMHCAQWNTFKPTFQLTNIRGMANQKHLKVIKLAKGYRGRANRCFQVAKHRVMKARQYMYRDRKVSWKCENIFFCKLTNKIYRLKKESFVSYGF